MSMRKRHLFTTLLLTACFALVGLAHADQEEEFYNAMLTAWSAGDTLTAHEQGKAWLDCVQSGGCPSMGPRYKDMAYVMGVATARLVGNEEVILSPQDFRRYAVEPLKEHVKVDQSNAVAKLSSLSSALKTLYDLEEPKSQDTENETIWYQWKAIIEQQKSNQFARPVDKQTAGLIIQYIQFCMNIVESTQYPELYRYRIRHACQIGFGADQVYDQYLQEYYDMTFLDEGNIRAGVFYQFGKDANYAGDIDKTEEYLKKAIDTGRTNKFKAECYRQLADSQFLQGEDFYDKANRNARAAYKLNPYNKDIRTLYGTTLYVMANQMFAKKQYPTAKRYAEEGVSFAHDSDHECYIVLAQVHQFEGNKLEAIKAARTAYMKACTRIKASADVEYFTNIYKNILTQFGQADKFRPCSGRN